MLPLLVGTVALCLFIEVCAQVVFSANRRAALAEKEEAECLAQSFQLVDACDRALDECIRVIGGAE